MVEILEGDCRLILPTLSADSFDAVVTDPPYHLTQLSRGGSPRQNDPNTPFGRTRLGSAGFMGKTWDGGDVAFDPATWAAVHRVLRPGAYLMAMGGTRTYHRLTVAIEDAGFEIRDCLMWIYGSGFPKHKACLKPALRLAIDAAVRAEREEVRRLRERVAELEAENAKLRAENADLDHDLSDHDALFNRNCALNEENEKLRTLLVKHQWANSSIRGYPQCPSCCGVAEDEGHYSDCEIAAAIRDTPKGEQS